MRLIDADIAKGRLEEYRKEFDSYGWHNEHAAVQHCMEILDRVPTIPSTNKPLTIEELRGMDGEPVWVTTDRLHQAASGWCVLKEDCALVPGTECYWWKLEDYGKTWLAYCRPLGGRL